MSDTNRTYQVFYNGKSRLISAPSLLSAKQAGIRYFNPPKSKQHMVTPVLCDEPIHVD